MTACPELQPPTDDAEPSITQELLLSHAQAMVDAGLPRAVALVLARKLVDQLLLRIGGRKRYLPKSTESTQEAAARRHQEILAAVRARVPFPLILRSFGISRVHFYRILRRHK